MRIERNGQLNFRLEFFYRRSCDENDSNKKVINQIERQKLKRSAFVGKCSQASGNLFWGNSSNDNGKKETTQPARALELHPVVISRVISWNPRGRMKETRVVSIRLAEALIRLLYPSCVGWGCVLFLFNVSLGFSTDLLRCPDHIQAPTLIQKQSIGLESRTWA